MKTDIMGHRSQALTKLSVYKQHVRKHLTAVTDLSI